MATYSVSLIFGVTRVPRKAFLEIISGVLKHIAMTIPYYTKNVLPIKCFKFSLDRGLQQFILNKGTAKRSIPSRH